MTQMKGAKFVLAQYTVRVYAPDDLASNETLDRALVEVEARLPAALRSMIYSGHLQLPPGFTVEVVQADEDL